MQTACRQNADPGLENNGTIVVTFSFPFFFFFFFIRRVNFLPSILSMFGNEYARSFYSKFWTIH